MMADELELEKIIARCTGVHLSTCPEVAGVGSYQARIYDDVGGFVIQPLEVYTTATDAQEALRGFLLRLLKGLDEAENLNKTLENEDDPKRQ